MKFLVGAIAAPLILFGNAQPAISHAKAAITTTAHDGRCYIKLRGEKKGSYLYLRAIKDTCRPHKFRVRAAGDCVITGFKAGNWIDRVHQKTSVSCSFAQPFDNYGYDRQANWPHGKVRFVSLDN